MQVPRAVRPHISTANPRIYMDPGSCPRHFDCRRHVFRRIFFNPPHAQLQLAVSLTIGAIPRLNFPLTPRGSSWQFLLGDQVYPYPSALLLSSIAYRSFSMRTTDLSGYNKTLFFTVFLFFRTASVYFHHSSSYFVQCAPPPDSRNDFTSGP